jgi:hypothetical protein
VRDKLNERRGRAGVPPVVANNTSPSPTDGVNPMDVNPHNLLPAIGSTPVHHDEVADGSSGDGGEARASSARGRSKTPAAQENDRYNRLSQSRGTSRGRAGTNASPDTTTDGASPAPHPDTIEAETATARASSTSPTKPPTKSAAAPTGKVTKKQAAAALKEQKELERKAQIEARKKKRDDIHKARAVEREAKRRREEAEKAGVGGEEDVFNQDELAGALADRGETSPSRATVVSVGDRVVFEEGPEEGLGPIERAFHQNSITEQLEVINGMDLALSPSPMPPSKTPTAPRTEAVPPPPYPAAEFADEAQREAAAEEPTAEPIPVKSRTGLIPAAERKKMAKPKTTAPPSAVKQLKIQTGVVKRLNKEASAYRKEGFDQLTKLAQLRTEAFQDFEVSKCILVCEETLRVIADVEFKLQAGLDECAQALDDTAAVQWTPECDEAAAVLKSTRAELAARADAPLAIPDPPTEPASPQAKKTKGKKKQKSPTPPLPSPEPEPEPEHDHAAEAAAAEAAEVQAVADAKAAAEANAAADKAAAEEAQAAADKATAEAHAAAEASKLKAKPPPKKAATKAVKGRASKATKGKTAAEPVEEDNERDARVLSPQPPASGVDMYAQAAMQGDAVLGEAHAPPVNLKPCKCCGRKFNPDRLAKHQTACEISAAKAAKRKVFDQSKARLAGTEMAGNKHKASKAQEEKYKKAAEKSKNFKAKSEAFRAGLRAAKDPNAAPAPPTVNPDYVQCPHCSRNFNEGAAERHMPKCAESAARNKKPSSAKSKKAKYDPRKKK